MKNQLNELVDRLTKEQKVECRRPSKSCQALKECIDRDYVHIMFVETGTEIGITLDRSESNLLDGDFEKGTGKILLTGGLTLNYNQAKCIANINLETCEGTACLLPIEEDEYRKIMKLKEA